MFHHGGGERAKRRPTLTTVLPSNAALTLAGVVPSSTSVDCGVPLGDRSVWWLAVDAFCCSSSRLPPRSHCRPRHAAPSTAPPPPRDPNTRTLVVRRGAARHLFALQEILQILMVRSEGRAANGGIAEQQRGTSTTCSGSRSLLSCAPPRGRPSSRRSTIVQQRCITGYGCGHAHLTGILDLWELRHGWERNLSTLDHTAPGTGATVETERSAAVGFTVASR
jgi:hypothetical protein